MEVTFHRDALNSLLDFHNVRVCIHTLIKYCQIVGAYSNAHLEILLPHCRSLHTALVGSFHRPTLYMICFNILWIWKKVLSSSVFFIVPYFKKNSIKKYVGISNFRPFLKLRHLYAIFYYNA